MRRLRVVPVALAGGGVLAVAVVTLALNGGGLEQPIAFNHRLHVEEAGMGCVDCHHGALTQARATIPNIEVCGDCHIEAMTESPVEAAVVEHVEREEPIPWRKVYRVPDHVYFSHRRHAAIGEIECARCHGEMAERELPVTRPALRPTMSSCIECHEESGVTRDCITCHV